MYHIPIHPIELMEKKIKLKEKKNKIKIKLIIIYIKKRLNL